MDNGKYTRERGSPDGNRSVSASTRSGAVRAEGSASAVSASSMGQYAALFKLAAAFRSSHSKSPRTTVATCAP